ncbi:MAG: vitamin K epoxide reductase family protein [Candidatus Andersenbacteria bacterium]
MHKLLFIIAILGLLVSGYLFATYTSPIPLVCGEGGGCHTVQESQYAAFFGVPTPAYGMMFYTALGILAAVWSRENTKKLYWPILIVASSGVAISAFLSYLEAFVIEAWCKWCIASAILTVLALLVVWMHPIRERSVTS